MTKLVSWQHSLETLVEGAHTTTVRQQGALPLPRRAQRAICCEDIFIGESAPPLKLRPPALVEQHEPAAARYTRRNGSSTGVWLACPARLECGAHSVLLSTVCGFSRAALHVCVVGSFRLFPSVAPLCNCASVVIVVWRVVPHFSGHHAFSR